MSKYKKFEDDISKMAPIFSKRVKKLLAENAMTQKDLAEKIDVSESSVSGWLSESSRKGFSDPKLSNALAVADVFNVPLEYLCGRTDSRKNDADYRLISRRLGLTGRSIDALENIKNRRLCGWVDGAGTVTANIISSDFVNHILSNRTLLLQLDQYFREFAAAKDAEEIYGAQSDYPERVEAAKAAIAQLVSAQIELLYKDCYVSNRIRSKKMFTLQSKVKKESNK